MKIFILFSLILLPLVVTAAGFRDVAEEVVWAKLKALSAGAEIATKRLL
jgi:hypothetical protein